MCVCVCVCIDIPEVLHVPNELPGRDFPERHQIFIAHIDGNGVVYKK